MLLRHQRGILIGFTLLIYSLQGYTNVQAVDEIISEQEGKRVVIPCPVNKDKCGELHSLNWFKGDNRIAAMLLDDSNVTSVAEEYEDRVSVQQNPFRLIIENLQIADEDIYLCDTTYFIPIETCDNFNGHRVELNVLVPPSEVVILDEKGDRIENGSIIGPMQERQMLKATCIVKNTRPQPSVGWWRGNKRLTTHSPSYDEKDGLFTATLELALQLSRDDLGHSIECRAESAAIENIISNHFSVNLQVRPTSITINGVEHHTVQGSKVVLTCEVHGARPAVNMTWYNGTQIISPEENELTEIRTRAIENPNGTYRTVSDLIFNATRFENDKQFLCEAENEVLKVNSEKPFQALMILEVMYPPVIKVSPVNATVNTGENILLYCEYVANPASLTSVVWYRNGEIVDVSDSTHYQGGNSEHVALSIRNTNKEDIGNYTCELSNDIGKAISEEQIELDVLFVPIVEVLMIPEGPVKESDESNVTLFCNILDANPSVLTKVRWYANSTLLKELPDCEETKEDLCHIDPSKLLLESIGRGFFYNYSCEGFNAAGWGPRSEDKELLVHYEPGPATLTHWPLIAVKKKSVNLHCNVDDPGYPESTRYRWLRGGRVVQSDVPTKDWTVEPVLLDSRTNYSCYAYNEGGNGTMATINLEVYAPPVFIKNLSPYTGVLHTSRQANLTCRIECVPRCNITWWKSGVEIEKNDTRYFVKEKYMDASPATADFESMLSVLHFNMSNWPNNKFDFEDEANYTCASTGNEVGPGIRSSTYFSIEYAPDNTTVSKDIVYVQEETIPKRVKCSAKANPTPQFHWYFNNKTIGDKESLIINTPMTRNDSGRYICVASNKHGKSSAETVIDVQYKPRCEIERKEIDDQDTLICTAFGNPEEADFSWSIKAENDSVEWLGSGDSKTFTDKSFYVLKEDYAIARTYRCVANNTAGTGSFCEIEVAEQLAWWQRWDKTTLIILVASILVLLLAVVIICCIIICICRRRRRQDKYRTDVSMSATHSVLSYQPNMPQLIPANSMLPDTLKVPIMSNILMPTLSAHEKQISSNPLPTPKPTPILTLKHIAKENISNISQIENTIIQIQTTATPTTTPATTTNAQNTLNTTNQSSSNTNTSTSTTPQLSVRHGTQAPKSPPRWPLRPGVMVHVSSDTKENLAVNRMTLKPNATLANLTASTLNDSSVSSSTLNQSGNTTQSTLLNVTRQSATLGRIGRQGRLDKAGTANKVEVAFPNNNGNNNDNNNCNTNEPTYATLPRRTTTANNVDNTGNEMIDEISTDLQTELQNMATVTTTDTETQRLTRQTESEIRVEVTMPQGSETTQVLPAAEVLAQASASVGRKSHLEWVQKFFAKFFFKRASKTNSCRDSQRSHVGLLGGKFWKRADQAAAPTGTVECPNSKSPFATEHRLKGIRSSGSVTYKKCAKTTATNVTSTTQTCTNTNSTSSAINDSNITNTITNLITTPTTITSAIISTNSQIVSPQQLQTHHPQQQQQLHLQAAAAQQQQHQRSCQQLQTQEPQSLYQLPASTILPEPFLNTSHPVISGDPKDVLSSIVTISASRPIMSPNVTPTRSNVPTNVTPSITSTTMSSVRGETANSSNNSSIRSTRKGILKAPTPPPRPPAPKRRAVAATPEQLRQHAAVQRSASLVCPMPKLDRVQMQEKSSSMADPLTEPGEYENLPFHGLQTAPNKFTTPTTPTNFNNNTNVVRSVPRPKRLNGNISQTATDADNNGTSTYYDEHETDPQQQYYQQQQQQQHHQYSTMPYNRHPGGVATNASASLNGGMMQNGTTRNDAGVIVHNNSLIANTLQHNQNAATAGGVGGAGLGPKSHQMTYNLNNCFPKSYTEYYQNQQQHQQQHQFQQQKYGSSPAGPTLGAHASQQMLNAIEHDFNTYAVVERPHNQATSSPASAPQSVRATNPFLAVSNFKKFDTSADEKVSVAANNNANMAGNHQTTSMKRQGKRKTFVEKLEDKRFYSLKFSGNKQKQQTNAKSTALNLNPALVEIEGSHLPENAFIGGGSGRALGTGMFGSLLGSGNKCKRHHSFAGGSLGDIEPKGPALRNGLHFYDPPAYENVNDAVQVHAASVLSDMELPDPMSSAGTATVMLHPLPYAMHNGSMVAGGTQGPKKKHHQRQHQPKEDLNLIEPERLSIYRSDSGISNSSYECVTPIPNNGSNHGTPPPGKTPRTPKTPKTPKGHKNPNLVHSAVTASFNSTHKKPAPRVPPPPLYMNVNDQQQQQHHPAIANLERPTSPNSNMATSAYESASSSQNDTTCNDPTSLSSTTSLYSSNKPLLPSQTRCNRHNQQAPELTTPEEYEQYQLGHHSHAHSASSLSVASSVSASGNSVGVGRTKCKKQQRSLGGPNINLMEPNKRPLAHNPFLATKPAATTAATCTKKFRRQTISDPYAHIKYINECNQWRKLQQYLAANNGQGNNNCTKSTNAFKAAATTTSDKPPACVAVKSQQHGQQQQQQQHQQIGLQQCNSSNTKNATPNGQQQNEQRLHSHNAYADNQPCHQQQMLMFYDNIIDNNKGSSSNSNVTNRAGHDIDGGIPTYCASDIMLPAVPNVADYQLGGPSGLMLKTADKNYNDGQSLNLPHMSLSCDVAGNVANDNIEAQLQLQHYQPHEQQHSIDSNVRLSNRPKLSMTIAAPNQSHCDDETLGCIGRPVKLPLRKYHSFHFQPTQTVAGQHLGKLQQLRANTQLQQQQLQECDLETQIESYKPCQQLYAQKGPLVFRPYQLDENVTFKPIQPSEESEDSLDLQNDSTKVDNRKQGDIVMDSGDFTNFSKLSTPKRNFELLPEQAPELPKTAPPLKNVSFYGESTEMSPISAKLYGSLSTDNQIIELQHDDDCSQLQESSHFQNTPKSLSSPKTNPQDLYYNPKMSKNYTGMQKFFQSPQYKNSKVSTVEDKLKSTSKLVEDINKNPATVGFESKNSPENSQDLQKSPNSAFVKTGSNRSLENVGISYITVDSEKSPMIARSKNQTKTSFLNMDLNQNPPQLETPQHLKALAKFSKPSHEMPKESSRQAKLEQLAKLYKLSSSESSEEDKTSLTPTNTPTKISPTRAGKTFTPRQLNFACDPQQQPKISTALNPAASLEALEMLTKSHAQLWGKNQAGSRQNLHQLELFHTLQTTKKANQIDDDEDLGYSFCEDDLNDDDDEEEYERVQGAQAKQADLTKQQSPNVTLVMAGQGQENQVKYILKQNHQEPLNTETFDDEFIYADLESQHYGPINYKNASIYAQVKKNKDGTLVEVKK